MKIPHISRGDSYIEIIFGRLCRVLLYRNPPAFGFVSQRLTFDWNVTRKLLFTVWWHK